MRVTCYQIIFKRTIFDNLKKRYSIPLVTIIALPVLVYFTIKLPVFGVLPSSEERKSFASSPAYNVERAVFENRVPERVDEMRANALSFELWKEWFSERSEEAPAEPLPEVVPDIAAFVQPAEHTKLIWLGHSSFLLNMGGTIILVDPVFSGSAAPVSFSVKRFQPPVLALEALPVIDLVLISHDHYDHLDKYTIEFFTEAQTQFLVPLGVGGHLHRWGISRDRIIEKDWWQTHEAFGVSFTAAPAQHFSGRDVFNNDKSLWASWIINNDTSRIYYSGDSGYDTHFKTIGEQYGPFDLAIMENGQYDKAWPAVHLMPSETLQATKDLKAKRLLPVHWGMFVLAFHTWYDPVEDLSNLAGVQQQTPNAVELVTPLMGQSIEINDAITTEQWWKGLR